MISGNYHYLQTRILTDGATEKVIINMLSLCRRIGIVKNITGNHKSVSLMLLYHSEKEIKEMAMFVGAVVTVESVSDMPIGSMYYLHFSIACYTIYKDKSFFISQAHTPATKYRQPQHTHGKQIPANRLYGKRWCTRQQTKLAKSGGVQMPVKRQNEQFFANL